MFVVALGELTEESVLCARCGWICEVHIAPANTTTAATIIGRPQFISLICVFGIVFSPFPGLLFLRNWIYRVVAASVSSIARHIAIGWGRSDGGIFGGTIVSERFRIAIVGSGPAGLSAAGRAAALGLSHVLLEKTDHLSDTIYKYQKGKHVMATPSQLILRSDQEFDAGKREVILQNWNDKTGALAVNVKYKAEVKSITGTGAAIPGSIQKIVSRNRDGTSSTTEIQRLEPPYAIELTNGETIIADTVILAIGTQGNPNLIRCPGSDLPHVTYQLDDPYAVLDEHIMVIGTGDAGIENARGLAEDPAQGNVVTVLNRAPKSTNVRESFPTAKEPNALALVADHDAGKLKVLLRGRNQGGRTGLDHAGDARWRGTPPLRPDHRPHRLGAAARLCRKLRDRVFLGGPAGVPDAVAGVRIDRARHLRDRRARRLSADQALHEPGL